MHDLSLYLGSMCWTLEALIISNSQSRHFLFGRGKILQILIDEVYNLIMVMNVIGHPSICKNYILKFVIFIILKKNDYYKFLFKVLQNITCALFKSFTLSVEQSFSKALP